MIIKRIVPNISGHDLAKARQFYGDLLGLDTAMDLGWIVTLASSNEMTTPQLSIAVEGGAGTAVPDLSIEVDDLDEAMNRIHAAGITIVRSCHRRMGCTTLLCSRPVRKTLKYTVAYLSHLCSQSEQTNLADCEQSRAGVGQKQIVRFK